MKENQMDTPLLKQLSYSALSQFWPREQQSLQEDWFPEQEELQRETRLISSRRGCRNTFWTVEGSRQQNRELKPCGKSQFCIRSLKIGTDHILIKNRGKIHGEEISSIKAVKVPLCSERYLRICPLYFSPMGRTEKKEVKKKMKTSFHGNKISLISFLVLIAVSLGTVVSSFRRKLIKELDFTQKKLEIVKAEIDKQNENEINAFK